MELLTWRAQSCGAFDLKSPKSWRFWLKEPQCPEQLKMSIQRSAGSHLATRAQNSSKWASRGHLGAIWQPTSDQNSSKWVSRDHLGATWPPELRTAQNETPETIWEPFGHQCPEQLKMSLQRPSGSHLATQKSWSFWRGAVVLKSKSNGAVVFKSIFQWGVYFWSESFHTFPWIVKNAVRFDSLNRELPYFSSTCAITQCELCLNRELP